MMRALAAFGELESAQQAANPGMISSRGRELAAEYNRNRYHQPDDEYNPEWDLSAIAADGAMLFAVGYSLADGTAWPNWSEDSEFRQVRDRSAAQRGPVADPAPPPAPGEPEKGERS